MVAGLEATATALTANPAAVGVPGAAELPLLLGGWVTGVEGVRALCCWASVPSDKLRALRRRTVELDDSLRKGAVLLREGPAPAGELPRGGRGVGDRANASQTLKSEGNSEHPRATHLPSALPFDTPLLRLDSVPADCTELLRGSGGERATPRLALLLLATLPRASLALDGRGWLVRGREAAELLL